MKRRIKKNAWDNWNGYEGSRRVREFGTDERAAIEWVNRKPVTLVFELLEDVTPELFAAKIANQCSAGALRSGESVYEPISKMKFTITDKMLPLYDILPR